MASFTFFFFNNNNNSGCHPWGAGVARFLSEQHLGIRPLAPGFSRFAFAPHVGGAGEPHVGGRVRTPTGDIVGSLTWSRALQRGTATLTVPPAAVCADVTLPAALHVASWRQAGTQRWQTWQPRELGPGAYEFAVHAHAAMPVVGDDPPAVPPASMYSAQVVRQDSRTQGSWKGVYGRDGYVLLAFEKNGAHDVVQLPPYVKYAGVGQNANIQPRRTVLAAPGATDPRALQVNRKEKKEKLRKVKRKRSKM